MRHEKNAADDRLLAVWAMVEMRAFPTVIAVASATREDDTPAIAAALVRLGAQAGRRIAALSLDGTAETKSSSLPIPASAASLESALAEWRSEYDAIILSVRAALEDTLRAHAIGLADGIVIAICANRTVSLADRDLGMLIAQVPGQVFGAVMTGCASRSGTAAKEVQARVGEPAVGRRSLEMPS
jgi:hypothetical protein